MVSGGAPPPPRLLLLARSLRAVIVAGGHAAISISVRPLVEVELGRPLVVPCTYNVSVASGVVTQWYIISTTSRVRISYRDSRRFVADADTGYTDRIDAQRDDSALALDATVVADERDFICQVFAGRAGVAEATTRVRLFSAPTVAVTASKRPVLLNGQRHEIGKCFVHNAYPEPHITWYKASLPLLPSPDVKVTRTVATEANGTFAVTSVLSYKPEERDVGARYRCVVNYTMPGGRSEAFASETIHVGLHCRRDALAQASNPRRLGTTFLALNRRLSRVARWGNPGGGGRDGSFHLVPPRSTPFHLVSSFHLVPPRCIIVPPRPTSCHPFHLVVSSSSSSSPRDEVEATPIWTSGTRREPRDSADSSAGGSSGGTSRADGAAWPRTRKT
ncbi:basal cell adhesion molecule-like isoform X3 [Petromyzon marinus]|uniref:basal cell adhesion molecule-like isoform X3 n=1 Tax=Petromyzon marinus TaxID=7757 RepID=UPI003F6F371E